MATRHMLAACVALGALAGATGVQAQARSAAQGAAQQQMQDLSRACGRACLESLVDDYVEAVAANDPARLNLSPDVKFTENGVVLPVGSAFWKTATGVGTYRHIFSDPEMGEVGAYVTMRENGQPCMLVVRLKREATGEVSEIETLVIRNARQVTTMEKSDFPLPTWTETVPPEERLSREQLVRSANAYFSAIENQDGRGVYPFDDECNRLENSSYTTNAGGTSFEGSLDDAATMAELNIQSLGCREQFETGNFAIDTDLHDRRFPVVDVERGAVFAMGFFDHNAKATTITFADGSSKPSRPALWTWQMSESFKMKRGLIHQIEAWMVEAQYHMGPGWTNFGRVHYGIVDNNAASGAPADE